LTGRYLSILTQLYSNIKRPAPHQLLSLYLLFAKNAIRFSLIATILFACSPQSSVSGHRYVVLSPEIAEILCSLGAIDRIVGVTNECDFPIELREKTQVGDFGQTSLERILALKPSIVFTTALEQADITVQLNKMNIKTIQKYPSTIDDLIAMVLSLGELTDFVSTADSLANYLREQFYTFEIEANQMEHKPRVYIEIYGSPIMTVSDGSFVGNLLRYTGGQNIFPKLPRDYCRINPEDVVNLNPDIIILTYPGITAEDVINRKGWDTVNAVKNRRIYGVDDIDPDLILRAGVRNVEGVNSLRKLILM
jgi:iron complex transport system substrate-binding protein